MRTAHRVRLAAILAVGAFALHQLRFLIAFGDSSSAELAQQGHRYMSELLAPIAVLVLAAPSPRCFAGPKGLHRQERRSCGVLLSSPRRCSPSTWGRSPSREYSPPGTRRAPPRCSPTVAGSRSRSRWRSAPCRRCSRASSRESSALIAVVHATRPQRARAPASRGRALPARGPSLLFNAPRLRPRQEAASAGTCLVRCQSARVVPSFRQRRQRARDQGGSSRCNRGLHGSA